MRTLSAVTLAAFLSLPVGLQASSSRAVHLDNPLTILAPEVSKPRDLIVSVNRFIATAPCQEQYVVTGKHIAEYFAGGDEFFTSLGTQLDSAVISPCEGIDMYFHGQSASFRIRHDWPIDLRIVLENPYRLEVAHRFSTEPESRYLQEAEEYPLGHEHVIYAARQGAARLEPVGAWSTAGYGLAWLADKLPGVDLIPDVKGTAFFISMGKYGCGFSEELSQTFLTDNHLKQHDVNKIEHEAQEAIKVGFEWLKKYD